MCLLPLQWLHCWLPIKPFPDASVSWCPPLELCPLQRLDQLPNRMLEVPLHPQLAADRGRFLEEGVISRVMYEAAQDRPHPSTHEATEPRDAGGAMPLIQH